MGQLTAIVGILFVLTAVLFPLFATSAPRPAAGVVKDGAGKPLPGVTLQFRDSQGKPIAALTTDADGRFTWRGLSTMRPRGICADGYGLTRYHPSTGNGGTYNFAPLVIHRIIAHDAAGRLSAGLPLSVENDFLGRSMSQSAPRRPLTTDADGMATIGSFPAGVRFPIRGAAVPSARTYAIVTQIELLPDEVRYTVLTGRTARLRGTALRPNGAPAQGATVIAYPKNDAVYINGVGVVGPEGRFQIEGLTPGTYRVALNRRDAAAVTLREGETGRLNIHE